LPPPIGFASIRELRGLSSGIPALPRAGRVRNVAPLRMHLLLPLLAAIAFAAGSLVYKRALSEGASLAHAVVVNNVVLGFTFLPLLVLDPHPVPWNQIHLPAITATSFVMGHLLNVASLRVGDVSVATPLLGAKVLFVALVAKFAFGEPITPLKTVAAALTTGGVLLTGITDFKPGRRAGVTTALALGCAAAFSVTDVLIQVWASRFGVFNFLALMFAALAVESLVLLPFLGVRTLIAPAAAWRWIGLAIGLSATQAILITGTIGIWKDAAGVNVVYGTRGLWSLVLVWWAGHWFGNAERHETSPGRMLTRAAGAVLILTAVVLSVLGNR
jgi:drug/metabolite transporter (DMT)-like permease